MKKVGKEIRSLVPVTLNITHSKSSRRAPALKGVLFIAALMALTLSPLRVAWNIAEASSSLRVWWPTEQARLAGIQPFKAVLEGVPVEHYEMFWQVDGGGLNRMDNSYTDYPHKESSVDVATWNWNSSGPYVLTFVAKQHGATVAERTVTIYTEAPAAASVSLAMEGAFPSLDPVQHVQMWDMVRAVESGRDSDPVHAAQARAFIEAQGNTRSLSSIAVPVAAPAPAQSGTNPISGNFYVNPNSPAATQARAWRQSRSEDAQKMDTLANAPSAQWFGGWSGNVQSAVERVVSEARTQGQLPVLVAYNIPQRDCGGFSAGGTDDYQSWIGAFSRGIGSSHALVILEPDALAGITCLSLDDQERRLALLAGAVAILKANPNTKVYVDAGHSQWIEPAAMASRLEKANIARADGFALNVSNFQPTPEEAAYGSALSERLGGVHFVIDTSRNGNGSNGEWCNPSGRRIGERPTTATGNPRIDAYLWIKTPGESDGSCNGGPSAGVWWSEYAARLVP